MKRILFLVFLILSFNKHWSQETKIEQSGDFLQITLPIAALGSAIVWGDSTKPVIQFVKTMAVSTIVTHGLKRAINKPRPNGGRHAFPSGHTSAAFTGAAFLERRFGWKIGVPAYALAGYVGWTRVHANKHDWWDILGGAIVGVGSAYLFTKPYQKTGIDISVKGFDRGGILIGMNYSF